MSFCKTFNLLDNVMAFGPDPEDEKQVVLVTPAGAVTIPLEDDYQEFATGLAATRKREQWVALDQGRNGNGAFMIDAGRVSHFFIAMRKNGIMVLFKPEKQKSGPLTHMEETGYEILPLGRLPIPVGPEQSWALREARKLASADNDFIGIVGVENGLFLRKQALADFTREGRQLHLAFRHCDIGPAVVVEEGSIVFADENAAAEAHGQLLSYEL